MVPHYMNQTISDQATGSADVAFGGLCWIIINFHLEAGTDKMEKGLFNTFCTPSRETRLANPYVLYPKP